METKNSHVKYNLSEIINSNDANNSIEYQQKIIKIDKTFSKEMKETILISQRIFKNNPIYDHGFDKQGVEYTETKNLLLKYDHDSDKKIIYIHFSCAVDNEKTFHFGLALSTLYYEDIISGVGVLPKFLSIVDTNDKKHKIIFDEEAEDIYLDALMNKRAMDYMSTSAMNEFIENVDENLIPSC